MVTHIVAHSRVLRVGQFKGVTQTLFRPTPVAMVTKICDIQHKISHNLACIRDYDRDTYTWKEVLSVGQFEDVTQTLLRPTSVAMVTKIRDFQHKIGHNLACLRDMTVILAPSRGY